MSVFLDRHVLRQAQDLVAEEKLDEAAHILEAFAGDDAQAPADKPEKYFWRDAADCARRAGLVDDALRLWDRARKAGLEDAIVRLEETVTLLMGARFEQALELAEALAVEQPRNAIVANLRAIALLECGRGPAALEEWDRCLKYSAQIECPLSTHPYYLSLGVMALERWLLEHDKADESGESEHLTALDPDAAELMPGKKPAGARFAKIEAALEARQTELALRWINAELRATEKPDPWLRVLRGSALGELGHWSMARRNLAAALIEERPEPLAVTFYAYCLHRDGDSGMALRVLDGCGSVGPDDYFHHYFRGCAWMGLGKRPQAIIQFQKAFQLFFFDNYHSLVLPTWKKAVRLIRSSC
jgi:tetratricopeptide (TPR) repeat protein